MSSKSSATTASGESAGGAPPAHTSQAQSAPGADSASTAGAPAAPPAISPRRYLLRGESMIASLGLATAAILLITMAASAWWVLWEKQEITADARQRHLRALTDQLSHSAESWLASNDVSALRRSVVEIKRENKLVAIRVTLTDGRVVADADPSRITSGELPARYPSGPVDAPPDASSPPGLIAIRRPLMVPGRGAATLELLASPASRSGGGGQFAAGLGAMSAAGLLALWLVYRHIRAKVRTLGLIRDGLLTMQAGERSREVLEIAGEHSPEVTAWNNLLREAETLRKGTLLSQLNYAPERRRETKSELELACDSLSVGMILLDAQGKARHANGAAASLLGFDREKLVGADVASLINHDEIKSAIRGIASGAAVQRRTAEVIRAHAVTDPSAARSAHAAQDRGPSSVLRVQVRPLRREDTCSVLVTVEDITQQRVAEASRHAFVAQATHELRTPLTNMRLCLETAIDEGAKDPALLSKSLNTLTQETRRLERVVSEMLSVAEIEAGSLRLNADDVRLDAVFQTLKADFEPMANEKKLALKFDMPPKIPVIHADRDKLVLAIHNLIGNALKYTPGGGKVTVALRADAHEVSVEVTDTGIGISEQDQPLVFEKFYRAKDPRVEKITGSGLGLALALEVARLHGGDISLRSQLDRGSTFTLTVPLVPPQTAASTTRAA